jgi:hypothetical protein
MSDIVPREKLTKQATQGVISVAGGVGAFILAGITVHPVLGIIVGGLITFAGLALAGSKHDRGPGVITTVVGAATLAAAIPFLSRLFGPLVHGVLVGAGIILVGVGVYSLVRFFRGMKSRA